MKVKEPTPADISEAASRTAASPKIACPYVYAKGKRFVRVEAFKADLCWTLDESNGKWKFWAGMPRSHYHLHCSEKGNHAGYGRDDALKYYGDKMPEGLLKAMDNESASGEKP